MQKAARIKRILAVILLLCLVAAFALCSAFVLSHALHECVEEGCPVCAQIEGCFCALRTLGGVTAAVAAFSYVLPLCRVTPRRSGVFFTPATLMNQKIRLNN